MTTSITENANLQQVDTKLLQIFADIKNSIAEIDDIKELLNIKNLASGYEKAWEGYYKTSGLGHDQMMLGFEAKIRATKKMGELLAKMNLRGGDRKSNSHDERLKLDDLGVSENQSYRYQKLADISDELLEKKFVEMRSSFKEPTTMEIFKTAHVSYNSGENEWYTPSPIIEAARRVMGSIDLDPASSDIANKTVKAQIYYTDETDGLDKKWGGNVWMNPPYSHPLIDKFIDKLVIELPNISQALILVNNATETGWFQRLLRYCKGVCFLKGRVQFVDKEGNPGGAPLQGQAILYFGDDKERFKSIFKDEGIILWTEE